MTRRNFLGALASALAVVTLPRMPRALPAVAGACPGGAGCRCVTTVNGMWTSARMRVEFGGAMRSERWHNGAWREAGPFLLTYS